MDGCVANNLENIFHWPTAFFYKNWPIPASFCLFSSFVHDINQIYIDKSIDGVLRNLTQGGRMDGADEST